MRTIIVDDDREKLFNALGVVSEVFKSRIAFAEFAKPWEAEAWSDRDSFVVPIRVDPSSTYTNKEWAKNLLRLKPHLIILDNHLVTSGVEPVAGMMIAQQIRRLPGGNEVVVFAHTYGGYGWNQPAAQRAFKRAGNVLHGAGSFEQLEPALMALKAERFPDK